MVNEHGAWRIAGKFMCVDSNLPAEARSVGRSAFQAAYLLSSLYLSVFLLLVVHIAKDYELLHSTLTKSSRCMCSISANSRTLHRDTGCAHTSCTHFNWIFELMSSLRSNYALYRDTMPLILTLNDIDDVFPYDRCGFYGNPIYMGYCSKCYKELVRDAQSEREQQGHRSLVGTPTHSLAPIDEQGGGANSSDTGQQILYMYVYVHKLVPSKCQLHAPFVMTSYLIKVFLEKLIVDRMKRLYCL